ncbi:MAG: hypothetical protein ACU833_03265 [Gammaproteobacteria bacterium]
MNKQFIAMTGALILTIGSNAVADQVILNDLIVDGSACIGFDCVNGENFGFDTIRLKENNTRIKFDDTSNSGSFPNTDWQLTANDSTNGGANKFSIEDISHSRTPFTIEASSPNHSLFVDDGGNVGFGTSTPVVNLHVKEGNTPTLRLEQDGSSGFTPQTWDVAGNETNFFVRDVTNGSQLPFKIFPGADHNSLVIAGNNNVGVGIQSPTAPFHLRRTGASADGSTDAVVRLEQTAANSNAGESWDIGVDATTGRLTFEVNSSGNKPLKFDDTAVENLMRLGVDASNVVDINGNLDVDGNITATGSITPDYVFSPYYKLPSIEEHAAFMWNEKHLPSVQKAVTNAEGKGVINIGDRSQGLLEELEIAHIYIERLHTQVSELQARLDKLENKE